MENNKKKMEKLNNKKLDETVISKSKNQVD